MGRKVISSMLPTCSLPYNPEVSADITMFHFLPERANGESLHPVARAKRLSNQRKEETKIFREIPKDEADGLPTPGPTPAPQGDGFNRPQEIPPEARDGLDGERGLGVSQSSSSPHATPQPLTLMRDQDYGDQRNDGR